MKEDKKEKEGRKRNGRPRARQALEKSGRGLFLLLLLVAELAMCQHCSGRTAEKDGDDGRDAAAGSSGKKRADGGQQLSSQKGEDSTEMKKVAKLLRCTLLNGSVWSTERKYMRR